MELISRLDLGTDSISVPEFFCVVFQISTPVVSGGIWTLGKYVVFDHVFDVMFQCLLFADIHVFITSVSTECFAVVCNVQCHI
jgi:hypothetical protein